MTVDVDPAVAAVGSCLLSPQTAREVCDVLDPSDVPDLRLRAVLVAVQSLLADGVVPDPVSVFPVARAVEVDGHRAGGIDGPWLADLVAAVPVVASGPHYAHLAAAEALRSRVGVAGQRLTDLAGEPQTDVQATLERARSYLADLEPRAGALVRLSDGMDELFTRIDDAKRVVRGVTTGIPELDDLLTGGGLRPGQMVIVGGRPGHGKSLVLLSLCRAAAREGTVGLVSLEMSRVELQERLLAAEARVNVQRLSEGVPNDDEIVRMGKASVDLDGLPIFISDRQKMTASEVGSYARRVRSRHGLTLLAVDYLGLLRRDRGDRRSAQEVVEDWTRYFKLLARELQVPVVVAAQLNRNAASRSGEQSAPRLEDLRSSGSVEQDADIVLLLDRPELRDKNTFRVGELDVTVAKQRGGRTGTVACVFEGHYARVRGAA